MNKKLLFGMFAATGMLLATSCQNDELDGAQPGNLAQVNFSLGLEGGLSTRAISDGTKADKLVYAVYKISPDGVAELQKVVGSNENSQFVKTDFTSGDKVSITLAKGQAYRVAFWAQDGDCEAYTTTDLTAVKVNYAEAVNNDELRDAFFKSVEFDVTGDKTIDVVLKRPFAQINLGIEESDWNAAVASGIEVQNSSVVIDHAADQINLLTGAVTGDVEVAYASNEIPDETLYVETDDTKDGKEAYKWLSMSYILVPDDGTAAIDGMEGANRANLESLEYTFTPSNGRTISFKEGLNNVPAQRNWRTNILGKILTGDININITVDPAYDNDELFPETSSEFAALELAASTGGSVTLTADVTMPEDRAFLKVTEDFILNINEGVDFTTGDRDNYGIIVANGTTEINGNGDIKSQGGGIGVANGASVVFNGGNLDVNSTSTSGRYLFYLDGEGSTATIKGGNFDFNKTQNQKRAYIYAGAGTTVYVQDGIFGKASTRAGYEKGIYGAGKVIITGGTFGFDPTEWVADGYTVNKEGDKWIVAAFIDLGLSVLWADRNIKAKSVADIGQYYSWADITDPTPETDDGDISWNWHNYTYWSDLNSDNDVTVDEMMKYNSDDNKLRIDFADDIVTQMYGADCYIPTIAQIEELINKCKWTWDADKKGCLITGPSGKSIFIPAGGYKRNTNIDGTLGTYCCIWSSDIDTSDLTKAWYLESNKDNPNKSTYLRHLGLPIRAVKNK